MQTLEYTPASTAADLIANIDSTVQQVADFMSPGPAEGQTDIGIQLATLMGEMGEVENNPDLGIATVSMEKMLSHVVAAKGLYATARRSFASNDHEHAVGMHEMGDLFLHYVVLDIIAMIRLSGVMARTEGGLEFGEKTIELQKAFHEMANGSMGKAQ